MNTVEVKKGNVLDSNFQVVAHQVNCEGVMGAGVAKAIKRKYPEVFEIYKTFCDNNEAEDIFGTCLTVKCDDGVYIANLFGQNSYGTEATQTNYKKLYTALMELKEDMLFNGLKTLSFPYLIGCGLAGGDENVVLSLIKEVFNDSEIIYNFYDINN